MSIVVTCGGCHTAFAFRDTSAGKHGKCPKCGAVIAVPAAGDADEPVLELETPTSLEPDEEPILELETPIPPTPRVVPARVPANDTFDPNLVLDLDSPTPQGPKDGPPVAKKPPRPPALLTAARLPVPPPPPPQPPAPSTAPAPAAAPQAPVVVTAARPSASAGQPSTPSAPSAGSLPTPSTKPASSSVKARASAKHNRPLAPPVWVWVAMAFLGGGSVVGLTVYLMLSGSGGGGSAKPPATVADRGGGTSKHGASSEEIDEELDLKHHTHNRPADGGTKKDTKDSGTTTPPPAAKENPPAAEIKPAPTEPRPSPEPPAAEPPKAEPPPAEPAEATVEDRRPPFSPGELTIDPDQMRERYESAAKIGFKPTAADQYDALAELARMMTFARYTRVGDGEKPLLEIVRQRSRVAEELFAKMRSHAFTAEQIKALNGFARQAVDKPLAGVVLEGVVIGGGPNAVLLDVESTDKRVWAPVVGDGSQLVGSRMLVVGVVGPQPMKISDQTGATLSVPMVFTYHTAELK